MDGKVEVVLFYASCNQCVICPRKVGVEYVNTCMQELFIMY